MITTLKTKTTQEDVYPNIQTSNIPDGGVTSAKIASSAINANKIGSGAVTEAKLSSNSVTSAKIASSAVTSMKLATNAVSETKIANGAVTDAKIVGVHGSKVTDRTIEVQKLLIRRYTFDKTNDQLTFNQLLGTLRILYRDTLVVNVFRLDEGDYPYDMYLDCQINYSFTNGEIYITFDGTTYTLAGDTDLTNFFNGGAGEDYTFCIEYIDGTKVVQ